MFKQNNLAKLYPHLKFGGLQQLRERSVSAGRHTPQPIVREKSIERPPKIVKFADPPAKIEEIPKPSEILEEKPKIDIVDPPTEIKPSKDLEIKVNDLLQTPPVKLENKGKPKPKRNSVIPKKGERGLQNKYTLEQKREMYLNQLSRKSVKRAEAEVAKVNQMLDECKNDLENLEHEEKKVKGRLRLINVAKYFAGLDNINAQTSDQKKTTYMSRPSGPTMSGTGDSGHQESNGGNRRGRSRRVETRPESGSDLDTVSESESEQQECCPTTTT